MGKPDGAANAIALAQGLKDIDSFTPTPVVFENTIGQYPYELKIRLTRTANKRWVWDVSQAVARVTLGEGDEKEFEDASKAAREAGRKWLKQQKGGR